MHRFASTLKHPSLHSNPFAKYHICFFGSDEFSLETLKQIHASQFATSLQIVCPLDQPSGRGLKLTPVAVKKYALEHQLPVHHPPDLTSLKNWNLPSSPQPFDLAIVVSFRYFIPKRIIQQFQMGAVNIHPSLLPQFRGAAPLHWQLLRGETKSGVSIIELDPNHFDVGKIVAQESFALSEDMLYKELYEKTKKLGAEMICNLLQKTPAELKNRLQHSQEQLKNSSIEIVDAPKVNKKMAQLYWSTEDAITIYNKYRAFADNIKCYTFFENRGKITRLIIKKMNNPRLLTEEEKSALSSLQLPGDVIYNSSSQLFYVKCANNTWISLDTIQMENGEPMQISKFLLGHSMVERFVEQNVE